MLLAALLLGAATLVPDSPAWIAPRTSSRALGFVAADTLRYLREAGGGETPAGEIADTLSFVARVASEDAISGADRLGDPRFLASCFTASRWIPEPRAPHDTIRLTRYLVYAVGGSTTRTQEFSRALRAVPHDEAGLTEEQALASSGGLARFRFTRQDVAAGAVDALADPLIWVADASHEQALMQGSIAVRIPGEASPRLFNVARSNGIRWDRSVQDTHRQRTYWYFREADTVRGFGVEPFAHIALAPEVSVAGDIAALGLGRLFALESNDGIRLVVLADRGGAFEHNLHQFDLYSGIFASTSAFDSATRSTGTRAAAWCLVRNPACP